MDWLVNKRQKQPNVVRFEFGRASGDASCAVADTGQRGIIGIMDRGPRGAL